METQDLCRSWKKKMQNKSSLLLLFSNEAADDNKWGLGCFSYGMPPIGLEIAQLTSDLCVPLNFSCPSPYWIVWKSLTFVSINWSTVIIYVVVSLVAMQRLFHWPVNNDGNSLFAIGITAYIWSLPDFVMPGVWCISCSIFKSRRTCDAFVPPFCQSCSNSMKFPLS